MRSRRWISTSISNPATETGPETRGRGFYGVSFATIQQAAPEHAGADDLCAAGLDAGVPEDAAGERAVGGGGRGTYSGAELGARPARGRARGVIGAAVVCAFRFRSGDGAALWPGAAWLSPEGAGG